MGGEWEGLWLAANLEGRRHPHPRKVGSELGKVGSELRKVGSELRKVGNISRELSLDMSVIQGSILGPILFLIYVDDLPPASNLETFLFADDTQGLIAGKNLNNLIDTVNAELEKWALWFCSNTMMVNTSKTKFIIFHTKGKRVEMGGKNIFFNQGQLNTTLEHIHSNHPDTSLRSYKLLGILHT